MTANEMWLASLRELHESSGLSYRDLAARCDLDHSYVALILEGKRRPSRDVLTLVLAFGYRIDLVETDHILMLPVIHLSAGRRDLSIARIVACRLQ